MFISDKNNEAFLSEMAALSNQGKSTSAFLFMVVRIKKMDYLLRQILTDLPANKDWLDPHLEEEAKQLTGVKN
jgi:hypothetical protein